jgi:GTP-binding protein Era
VLAADEPIGAGDRFVASRVLGGAVPAVIVVNKVDRLRPAEIARSIEAAAALGEFHALHPVSAATGDGIDALRDDLVALLPEGIAYFPPDTLSDQPLELRIAELVREQALALTREEVPHAITVEVEEVGPRRIEASILVETASQKQIVVGKGGAVVKEIGVRARPELERLVGHKVFLDLRVKVKEKWRRDQQLLERLGL